MRLEHSTTWNKSTIAHFLNQQSAKILNTEVNVLLNWTIFLIGVVKL